MGVIFRQIKADSREDGHLSRDRSARVQCGLPTSHYLVWTDSSVASRSHTVLNNI